MRVIPSYLHRHWLSAWVRLLTRLLVAMGLLSAATLAAVAHNGPMSLVFFTVTAFVGIAIVRAHQVTRRASTALRFHRTVDNALNVLVPRGWHLKHNVSWPEGRGNGHLAMSPSGQLAFAIKDCTTEIGDFDLAQTQDFATALSDTGRPYVPICVAASNGERSSADRGVVCCSPGQLAAELLEAESAFMTSLLDEAARNELLYSQSSVN